MTILGFIKAQPVTDVFAEEIWDYTEVTTENNISNVPTIIGKTPPPHTHTHSVLCTL